MASFSGYLASDSTIRWEFSGLEHPASEYSFRVSTSDGNGTSWSDGTTYDFTYNHSCGITVTGDGYATWGGTEYLINSYSVATQACPVFPPTGTPSVSATYNPSGGVHYINVYWNTVANATYYNIYANNNSGSGDVLKATSTGTSQQITVDTPNKTYTIKVQACNSGGCSSSSGSVNVNTSTRPLQFSWQYSVISSGQNAVVDTRDWDALTKNIDDLRVYKGLTTYGFTGASGLSGQGIPAFMFNQLVNGANALSSYMTNNLMPSTKATGNDFYAVYLSNIATSINSIP